MNWFLEGSLNLIALHLNLERVDILRVNFVHSIGKCMLDKYSNNQGCKILIIQERIEKKEIELQAKSAFSIIVKFNISLFYEIN